MSVDIPAVNIKALAKTYEAYIVDRRRYYHANPELSGQEEQTRRQIRRDLEAMDITEITELRDCFGITAMIRGGRPGRTVALRADIDALPVREDSGLPFAAVNGCMHACGHDSHIAMLLGAARMLRDVREKLAGNVKLIFQPAEEIASGAGWMLRENALEGVDALYGAHIWGTLDAPLVDVSPRQPHGLQPPLYHPGGGPVSPRLRAPLGAGPHHGGLHHCHQLAAVCLQDE